MTEMEIKWKLFSFLWRISIWMKRLYRSQKRPCLLATLAALLALLSVYWFLIKEDPFKYPDIKKTNELVKVRLHELVSVEKGSGCVMPRLDPFSEEAMSFSQDVDPLVCHGLDWVECYLSECKPTARILRQMKDLVCIYRDILFLTDQENQIMEPVKVYGGGSYVLNRSDHVKVSCTGTDVTGLGLLSSRWFGYKLGFRPLTRPPTSSLNIMMVLFDSTSRNGFIRRMPKSYRFLVEELKAVVMKSYNIVMDGTPGALFPMLTGHMELELPDARKTLTNKNTIDDTPFIFHLLREHGYRTAYFEDMPWIGTFQYRFNGFKSPPTDHYSRPLMMEEANNGYKWWGSKDRRHCVGDKTQHWFMLNATSQFFDLPGSKFCLTFIASISHEDFNMISVADDDLVSFLKQYQEKWIDDTVLILMGDHGPRFASIRNTYQGKIEERLPFVSLVLPHNLNSARPDALKNLQSNVDVLTTHYDMHTTLLDILGLKEERNQFVVSGADYERGLSILEPIPNSRSCAEAGIMPHWCACAKWHNVSSTETMYKRAAIMLAEYIDGISRERRSQCAPRTLSSIEWVVRQSPNEGMLGFKGRREVDRYVGKYERSKHVRAPNEYYQAKIVMKPGHSIFEGSMQYLVRDDIFVISERDISRVNAYSNEPKCVSATLPHLRKYCYCYNMLNKVPN